MGGPENRRNGKSDPRRMKETISDRPPLSPLFPGLPTIIRPHLAAVTGPDGGFSSRYRSELNTKVRESAKMLVRARSLAIVLLVLVLASPAFLHTPAATAAASQPATTLSVGVVTSSPLESLSDLNNINSINEAFFGVLSGFDTAVNIRPYYHLLT